jgi:hypothetical protein
MDGYMQLDKIAKIIGIKGEISDADKEVFRATAKVAEAEEGDLCFAESETEVKEALKRGASVVVYQKRDLQASEPLSSDHATLLEVPDIAAAALRLAGYITDERSASMALIDPKTLTFFRMIVKQRRSVDLLDLAWQDTFERVMAGEKRFYVTTDERYFAALRPKVPAFEKMVSGHVVSADTLFRTTFKIEKYIYQYKPFVHFHLDALRRAVALCEMFELAYDLDRIKWSKHMKPIFLEGEPSVQEVMKNEKVVILSDNLEDILEARQYAANVGQWMAKTVVAVPPKTTVEGVKYPTIYRSEEELLALVGSVAYNYLFIYTDDEKLAGKIAAEYGDGA